MKNIQKSQLFKVYFLLLKVFYVSMGLFALTILDFSAFSLIVALFSIGMLGLQFWGVIKAESLMEEKKVEGYLLAMLLTILAVPGYSFPLAIFGFYCLLNKEFREENLPHELPLWLQDAFFKLDQLTSKKAR